MENGGADIKDGKIFKIEETLKILENQNLILVICKADREDCIDILLKVDFQKIQKIRGIQTRIKIRMNMEIKETEVKVLA